jgi:quaternary ammonium compound-resistance protein SugE
MALALVSMVLSGGLLWLAQLDMPMGSGHAVWTGIGGAGVFLIGVFFRVTQHPRASSPALP